MNRFRGFHYLLYLGLLFGVLGGLFGGQVIFAAQESSNGSYLPPPSQEEPPPTEPPEEWLEIIAKHPILQNTSGGSFEYEVDFNYHGTERRTFNLNLILPPGWTGTFKGGYPEREIEAFEPDPGFFQQGTKIKVLVSPEPRTFPEPGEYVFTFEAASGDVKDSVELKAVVIPVPPYYELVMVNPTLQSEVEVQSGEDNHMSIIVANSGTGLIENITLSSVKPEGWDITFTPSEFESLEPELLQEVDVVMTPPPDTEAGDYPIILKATSEKAESELELKATTLTSTAWAGPAIGGAIAAIAGLVFWFRRAGKQ